MASVIALGLALQAKANKTSDWHGGQDAPVVNLLPWRGRRLQHMQRSFQLQLVTAACLTLAVMWTWVTVLQAQVAEEQTYLVRVQNTKIKRGPRRHKAMSPRRILVWPIAVLAN